MTSATWTRRDMVGRWRKAWQVRGRGQTTLTGTDRKMETGGGQKLRLLRGGEYARRGTRHEVEGERLMREKFVALQRSGGKPRSDEVIHNIAEGRTYPTRRIRKLLARLKAKQVAREQAWAAVMEPMQREFVSVFGTTGEHVPPAA